MSSIEQLALLHRLRSAWRAQDLPQALLPAVDVEMVLVQEGPPRSGGKFVERREQVGDRLPQRLGLEAALAGPHVLEDALLGAGRDDRLRASLDEDVGGTLGAAGVLDRGQAGDSPPPPVLAVAEKDHAVALDLHGASRPSPAVHCPWVPVRVAEPGHHPLDDAHWLRRAKMASSTTL